MQTQLIITIDNNVPTGYAIDVLKNINFIRSIKPKNSKKISIPMIDEVTLLAEKSLAEEWLSDEDNRWDKLL